MTMDQSYVDSRRLLWIAFVVKAHCNLLMQPAVRRDVQIVFDMVSMILQNVDVKEIVQYFFGDEGSTFLKGSDVDKMMKRYKSSQQVSERDNPEVGIETQSIYTV